MIFRSSKLTLWLLSILTVVLVALLVLDVYHIRSENKETSELLLMADESAAEESLVQSIRSLQNTAGDELEELDAIAVSDNNLVLAIEKIEEIGRRLGLESEIAAVDEVEGEMPRVRITLKSNGSWPDTFSLLRAAEELPYRVMLESVSLSKNETAWQATITLSLYLFN